MRQAAMRIMRIWRSFLGRVASPAVLGAILSISLAPIAQAEELATSVLRPTPVGPTGVVEAAFPEGKATYFVSVGVKPGELLTQIGFEGRPGARKAVDLALLGPDGRRVDSYWAHGEEVAEQKTRAFAIDAGGERTLRIEVEGPPTARFRVEVGGSALANAAPKPLPGDGLSRSVFAPTLVGSDGVVSGALPGPGQRAIYFVAVPVQPGDLLTQMTVRSREGAWKALSFELLGKDARAGESYWVHGEAASEEKTRSFPIDASGSQLIRLVAEGPETGSFQVEFGGSALASPQGASSSTAPAGAEQVVRVFP